jgi:hypothetical protein
MPLHRAGWTLHWEVEFMYEQTQPPAEVIEAIAEHQRSRAAGEEAAGAVLDRADLAALAAPLEAALRTDPAASAALDKVTRAVAEFPKVPASTFGGRFADLGFRSDTLHVREAPFDYAGAVPAGHVFGFPQTGRISVGGRVGHVEDATPGDRMRFIGWIGIAVTAESAGARPGQTVRVSPSISWDAGWTLTLGGINSPWAEARGGVALKVFSSTGFVTENSPPVELFSDHYSASPGLLSTRDRSDSGLSTPGMHVWFSIPAGETRWVNVDAYCEVATGYNGFTNVAAAQGGLAATIRFIVLDPQ